MQTILGANGTIGKILAQELVKHTSRIRLVSRNPKKVNPADELFPADLSDPSIVDKAIEGSEVVYLLVGFDYNIKVWQQKWPRLMRAVLDACIRHGSKLVFFDNVYLYDVSAIPHMTEGSPVNPPSKKGQVRKEIAEMLMNEVKAGRITALIARAADFYGPENEKSFLIEVVYKNLKKGKRPMWFADLDKKHSFTYTPDAAHAVAVLGNSSDAWNQVWHLPTDPNALTGRQMAELFMKEMGVDLKASILPRWMITIIGLFVPFMREMPEMLYQYDRDYIFDSGKFVKRFGIKATPYQQGVREVVKRGAQAGMPLKPLTRLLIAGFLMAATPVMAQLADDKCMFLGNVIPDATPSDFKTYWNQVTPENAGKWGSVEAEQDVMDWAELDNAYDYAQSNDFPFKQHTLVWGQQQPGWIGDLTAEEQKQEVEEWIQAFCERYPETDFIDVVNEPLHAVPSYSGALGGSGATGWDWVIWAFEKARQYCPDAKLILNDYNILSSNAATTNYLAIINILKERGLIDIIGEQGHFMETTPSATIKNNLDRLSATGLPIHISEYDVNIADDAAQSAKYQEQFPILWEHKGVHGITLWGYRQGQIWRESAFLIRTNGSARPAMTWLSNYVKSSKGGTFCNPVTGMLGDEPGLDIYPIPVRDGRFTLDSGRGNFDVRIVDLRGNVKKELTVKANGPVTVELREAAGLYLVQVSDGNRTRWQKIILN